MLIVYSDAKLHFFQEYDGQSVELVQFIQRLFSYAYFTSVSSILVNSLAFIGLFVSQETTETKRKNAKRTFKSEKEFLGFSLKYQQVLTERDAGKLK